MTGLCPWLMVHGLNFPLLLAVVKPSDYLALDAEGEPYPTNPVSFADFELRVRSSHDPMLELRLLTEDG